MNLKRKIWNYFNEYIDIYIYRESEIDKLIETHRKRKRKKERERERERERVREREKKEMNASCGNTDIIAFCSELHREKKMFY